MSTRVDALAGNVRHCRRCDNVIPFGSARRIYCSEHCRRAGDNARHRERYKAKTEIYAALGLGGQSGKPSCNDLLAAGYDRYCPICERNYKPGESKTCGCERGLYPIEWHIPQDVDLDGAAAAIERGFV
jgi:predicted nucleic acid-binding Zn ribbon protein